MSKSRGQIHKDKHAHPAQEVGLCDELNKCTAALFSARVPAFVACPSLCDRVGVLDGRRLRQATEGLEV